ncbi:efflux RND transporter periplasmic adaptor subunit [Engelhardtia mirabilis]|uniref:Multidrug resistance protein MdtA n=1 Tax=Engelhardtia mirabilis TaxID=2528011 RepID=A0A518BPY3_9BACT|nr:Multidrug resistance protein MdtA precursor [Planctomycetes bacterium Pla133]QDV03363.1 Multidrug resistance protein MdtA precursor [Planctomycetes bacterium Pla86]
MLHSRPPRQDPSSSSLRGSIAAASLTLIVALAGCTKGQERSPEVSAAADQGMRERQAARVVTIPVARREMVRLLETTSVVESETEIDVVPRASGLVTHVLVEEGDEVEAGQVLARLDSREETMALRDSQIALEEAEHAVTTAAVAVAEAESRIATAQSALEQAERDYQRDVALRTGGANPFGSVSERTVEASKLARDQAEQELAQSQLALQRAKADEGAARTSVTRAQVTSERAELTLERMTITAPITGRVASRDVRVGATVDMAQPVFRITDTAKLRTVFYRPQRELSLFRTAGDDDGGLELTATAEAAPGAVFRGHIERTSPTIDATSGSFRVTAGLERYPEEGPEAGALLPGMLARIRIVTDRRPGALAVPKRAVRREGEQSFVQVADGGVARRVLVAEGYSDDEYVELRLEPGAELAVGDRVIVVGGRDLEEGDAVTEGDESAKAIADQALAASQASEFASEDGAVASDRAADGPDSGGGAGSESTDSNSGDGR